MEINLNFIYQISEGLNYFFLWIIFLAILIFAVWAYLYSRWNVLGPRFKNRYSKTAREANKKEKTSIDKQLQTIQKQLDTASDDNLSSQEILTLQTEYERLEQKKLQEEQKQREIEEQKQREAELKQQIKQNKKDAKSKKNSPDTLVSEEIIDEKSNNEDLKSNKNVDETPIIEPISGNFAPNNRKNIAHKKQQNALKMLEQSEIYNHD